VPASGLTPLEIGPVDRRSVLLRGSVTMVDLPRCRDSASVPTRISDWIEERLAIVILAKIGILIGIVAFLLAVAWLVSAGLILLGTLHE
jgi:hypothetical protein